MWNITQDYFPQGKDWHRYMTEVVELAGIKVQHGVQVSRIFNKGSNKQPCVKIVDGTERCANRRIFVGTGLKERPERLLRAIGGIPYSKITKEKARFRRVCILGNGNSGFEVAQNLYEVADRVTIYGKYTHRLSSVTRYTGDVRLKYLQVLENMNGKLLDTVDSFEQINPPQTKGLEQVLNQTGIEMVQSAIRSAAYLNQYQCEKFVITTGFQSHVPNWSVESAGRTFPSSNDWYESTEYDNVHYIGWLMHERDFRKGAGGFFSGFRYLIRNLVHRVREQDQGVSYPYELMTSDQVVKHVVDRFQFADDLVILQDGVILRDLIIPSDDDAGMYKYYQGVTYHFHKELMQANGVTAIYFSWGDGRTRNAGHVFDSVYRFADSGRLINSFLHPVVETGGLVREIPEDLEMTWQDPNYVAAIEKVIRKALKRDLEDFSPRKIFPYRKTEYNQSQHGDPSYEPVRLSAGVDNSIVQALWKTVYTNYRDQEVHNLKEAMKTWMPALFDHRDRECEEAEAVSFSQ